jgi:energy-coupling factor transport system substrate-specific component
VAAAIGQASAGASPRPAGRGWGAGVVVGVASLVGLAAFLYPFLLPAVAGVGERSARTGEAPFVLAALTAACLLAIAAELSSPALGPGAASKTVALLGVLVATDATLRLAPSLVGASPLFLLILLVGHVYGPAFGFLMGSLTLLLSAFLTGGLGPWLPYQMLGAGWVGLTAGWLPRPAAPRARLALLAAFGAVWGLLYGALLNLWSWPFAAPGLGADAGLFWHPGLGFGETVTRYARFYLVTSLGHDLFRAAGNLLLVLALGGPILRVLDRFRARFAWQPWVADPSPDSGPAPTPPEATAPAG